MKAIAVILFFACSVLWNVSANAQDKAKFFTAGFGIEGGLAGGNAEAGMKGSFGAGLNFAFHVGPGYITLNGGINGFFGHNNDSGKYLNGDYTGGIFPVRIGYKYFIIHHLFIMADAGAQRYFLSHGDGNGHDQNVQGTGFTYSPAIGGQFGVFEIAVKYEVFVVNGGNLNTAAVRLGFDF